MRHNSDAIGVKSDVMILPPAMWNVDVLARKWQRYYVTLVLMHCGILNEHQMRCHAHILSE